ncbi:MAG: hypothetical protein FIB03_02570 [Anaerolineae bacterium]|nr:hypothetical protein [Anaerolineae bacterium]
MNKRDLELLSAYLDGELKPSDSTKLEARLKSDTQLASVLNDLRVTRSLLRGLPSRKAPRNFTLTRKMVGQNPPLPRTYPVFRFATAIATLLFVFSIGFNTLAPQIASQPPAFGMGGGGGGGEAESYAAEAPAEEPAMEQPAAPAPALFPTPTAAADASEPSIALAPQGTEVPPTEELSTMMETPVEKNGVGGGVESPDQYARETQRQVPLIPSIWVAGLAIVAVISALVMGLMRRLSAQRWK